MQAQRFGERPPGKEAGGEFRRSVFDGGDVADTFKQIVGNETNVKLAGLGLRDEEVAALGEDQGIDAGGNEIVEQMARVI